MKLKYPMIAIRDPRKKMATNNAGFPLLNTRTKVLLDRLLARIRREKINRIMKMMGIPSTNMKLKSSKNISMKKEAKIPMKTINTKGPP